MMELIDTHLHLDDEQYDQDLMEVLARAEANGVTTMVNAGSTAGANLKLLSLIKSHQPIFGAVGLHPHEFPEQALQQLDMLPMQLAQEKIVALGEIGLDYHIFSDYPPPNHEAQQAAFAAQLSLAKKFELPVMVHVREAMEDALAMLQAAGPFPNQGVLHCYSGGTAYLEQVLDLGFFIGIGGPVTYPKSDDMRAVVAAVPLERLLLETDAPYLPPQGKRGKRHEPAWIMDSARLMADLKGMSLEELAEATTQNAQQLFKLKPNSIGPIVYDIDNHLYVNLTNRCSSRCTFCPREVNRVVKGYDLTLAREPFAQEVIDKIGDPKRFHEIVFCGFGEPTLRLPVLLAIAQAVKARGGTVRVNTNGQCDALFGQDILPMTKDLVDHWSISVNTMNAADYERAMRPATGPNTHAAVLDFARRAVNWAKVTVSDVDMPGMDIKGVEAFAQAIGASYRGRHFQRLGQPGERR